MQDAGTVPMKMGVNAGWMQVAMTNYGILPPKTTHFHAFDQ